MSELCFWVVRTIRKIIFPVLLVSVAGYYLLKGTSLFDTLAEPMDKAITFSGSIYGSCIIANLCAIVVGSIAKIFCRGGEMSVADRIDVRSVSNKTTSEQSKNYKDYSYDNISSEESDWGEERRKAMEQESRKLKKAEYEEWQYEYSRALSNLEWDINHDDPEGAENDKLDMQNALYEMEKIAIELGDIETAKKLRTQRYRLK